MAAASLIERGIPYQFKLRYGEAAVLLARYFPFLEM
jgi:hypothetical protein